MLRTRRQIEAFARTGLDPYATHIPVLYQIFAGDPTPFGRLNIECGCGFYSTPLLAAASVAREGKFMAFETDKEWAEVINTAMDQSFVHHITDWSQILPHIKGRKTQWFIDNGPRGHDRMIPAQLALEAGAETIVLHDSNVLPEIVEVISAKMGPPAVVFKSLPPEPAVWFAEYRS